MSDPGAGLAKLLALHAESSNRNGRPAAAPVEPDRSIEPVRFRRFRGAPLVPLPSCPLEPSMADRPAPGPRRLDRSSVAQLFLDAFGITGEARYGTQSSPLRANPSAGNLHPVEAYLLCGPEAGLARPDAPGEPPAALWHYAPDEHAFELRRRLPLEAWRRWAEAAPPQTLFVGLSAIVWRTAWKYGARAFRLALLDAGHAVGALRAAAAGLGWRATEVLGLGDAALAELLALETEGDPASRETPLALLAIGPRPEASWRIEQLKEAAGALGTPPRIGRPNRIGPAAREWPGLLEIERLTRDEGTPGRPTAGKESEGIFPREVLHRRRSARAFDPSRALTFDLFTSLAGHGFGDCPQGFAPGDPMLAAWVHRVERIDRGSHRISRTAPGCPETLVRGDLRAAARSAAGGQALAADAFVVFAWLADLPEALRLGSASAYRRLFFEAGARAHRMHLAAVRGGLAACPIGGFYDDRVSAALGFGEPWAPLHLLAVGFAPGISG